MAKIFIATLGIGKGTWGHVARLITEGTWDKILLISNEWGKENFNQVANAEWIIINTNAGFDSLKETMKEKIPKGEVFINITSGSGKEHMALLAALKESKTDFKIITLTGEGTKSY